MAFDPFDPFEPDPRPGAGGIPAGYSVGRKNYTAPPVSTPRPPAPVAQSPPVAVLVQTNGLMPQPVLTPPTLVRPSAIQATPVQAAALAVGGVALARVAWLALGRFVSLGAIRAFVARWGPAAFRTIVGVALFSQIMELFDGGAGDDLVFDVGRRRSGRRYSIGANPRLNTLIKVAKRVDNIFIRYDSRMKKFRSRIKGAHQHRPRAHHYIRHERTHRAH